MVGRDLQYIRLNGTIVGALAGLVDLHDRAGSARLTSGFGRSPGGDERYPVHMADRPDQLLFTYGTLQTPEVQLDTFGRLLDGDDDILPGYTVDYVEIEDPRVVDVSGPVRAPDRPRDRQPARQGHRHGAAG